jgi:hypothetical protein
VTGQHSTDAVKIDGEDSAPNVAGIPATDQAPEADGCESANLPVDRQTKNHGSGSSEPNEEIDDGGPLCI